MANIITWNNRIIDFTNASPTPSFSPLDYSPIAWYDSSDVASINYDLVNYKVSQWNDKSGNNYHLVQGSDLNKPLYSATNGIVFDGINDYMNKSLGTTYNQPFTVFLVFNKPYSTGVQIYIANENNTTTIYHNGNLNGIYDGSITLTYGSGYNDVYKINTYILNSSSYVYSNNTQVANGSLNNLHYNSFYIGATSSGNFYLKGSIKEIIIYNSALTTDKITAVNTYLNTKYGGIY